MRVTNRQTAEIIMKDLARNHQLLVDSQIRVSTGKRINKPSDDPLGARDVLNYRKILASIEQYNRNIDRGNMHYELTETVLDEVDTLLKEAKQWAVTYGSGAIEPGSPEESAAITRVKGVYDDIMDLANSKIGENYIFAGHVTNTEPFSRDADGTTGTADDWTAAYGGDDGDINMLVNDNISVKINATGRDIFDVGGTGGGTDVFGALENLIIAMEAGNEANAFAEIVNIQSSIDQVQKLATETSVYATRVKSAQNYLNQYEAKIQDLVYETENVDMAQAIVEMQLQESTYLTNLQTASKVIQPSLVDYL